MLINLDMQWASVFREAKDQACNNTIGLSAICAQVLPTGLRWLQRHFLEQDCASLAGVTQFVSQVDSQVDYPCVNYSL